MSADTTWNEVDEIGGPVLFEDRFELGEELGRGAFGVVRAARDVLTGDDVAIKSVRTDDPTLAVSARREAAALRLVHVPGVVELLDEYRTEGATHFVMRRVRGQPFPGMPTPASWHQLEPAATRLLEVLASVHFLGLVHRDLKPGNVLVDGASVHLVDLGISSQRLLQPETERYAFEGTLAYAAPEQRRDGEVGPRADLYSLGVMLYEALTGRLPHADVSVRSLLLDEADPPHMPLASHAPTAPPQILSLVESLLQPDPEDRPPSAQQALRSLGATPGLASLRLADRLGERSDVDQLRELFTGSNRFLRTLPVAAEALWDRTGGRRDRVLEELDSWIRSGIARLEPSGVLLTGDGLEELRDGLRLHVPPPCGPREELPRRLLALIAFGFPHADLEALRRVTGLPLADLRATVDELIREGVVWRTRRGTLACAEAPGSADPADLEQLQRGLPRSSSLRPQLAMRLQLDDLPEIVAETADTLSARGSFGTAFRIASLGLAEALIRNDPSAGRLAMRLTSAALELERRAPLEHALRLLDVAESRVVEVSSLTRLVRAGIALSERDATRAERLLEHASIPDREDLQFWYQAMRHQVSRAQGAAAEEACLQALETWARQAPEREARWLGWLGHLRYRQGEYHDAAALHLRSLAMRRVDAARASAALNAAGALLETEALDLAARHAHTARDLALQQGLSQLAARATWVHRSARYRRGEPVVADLSLVQEAAQVGRVSGALLAVTEAAIAWRSGRSDLARQLARVGRPLAAGARLSAAHLLLQALDGTATAEHIAACPLPAVALQAAALVMPGAGVPVARQDWISGLSPFDRERCREVASVAWCLERLGGDQGMSTA